MSTVPRAARTLAALRSGFLAAVEPSRLARARGLAAPLSAEPLVSIPIATYDRPDVVLDRTLPALLAQSYERLEVILVGDGCAPEVTKRLAAVRHPKVQFHNLRRRSHYPSDPVHRWMVAGSRPRNVGARIARGELLLWMSDDDLLYPSALATFVATLTDGEAEVSLGAFDVSPDIVVSPGTSASTRTSMAGGGPAAKVWVGREYLRRFRWSRTSWMKHWNRPCDHDLFSRMQHAGVRFASTEIPVALVLPVEGTHLHGSRAWAHLYGPDAGHDAEEGG
jgi:glycosyltransferase involved in cell wall biosynthesis